MKPCTATAGRAANATLASSSHALAPRERGEMRGEQLHIEGIGMIPVHVMQLRQREVPEVAIVRVHLEKGDRSVGQCFGDLARHGGLSRAGAAGDPDDQRFHERHVRFRHCTMTNLSPGRDRTATTV